MPRYSKHHVRRALRQLVAAGLVRCDRIQPGECFPDKDAPDVDGGGMETQRGGNVVEINVDALLGRGPVWLPPPPQSPSQAALDADAAEGPAEAFPGLPGRAGEAASAAVGSEAARSGESDHPCRRAGDHR